MSPASSLPIPGTGPGPATTGTGILTLNEAVAELRKHRDMALAAQPMPNYSVTPGGPNGGVPFSFRSSWTLASRPRRIALLFCQEEYRHFATDIIPNLVDLVKVFQEKQLQDEVETVTTETETSPCPLIVWSSWTRTFDDVISNAMDRWYGPHGLSVRTSPRMPSTFSRALLELPCSRRFLRQSKNANKGVHYHGKHLDMFWTFV
jgi:hypothetical protein